MLLADEVLVNALPLCRHRNAVDGLLQVVDAVAGVARIVFAEVKARLMPLKLMLKGMSWRPSLKGCWGPGGVDVPRSLRHLGSRAAVVVLRLAFGEGW